MKKINKIVLMLCFMQYVKSSLQKLIKNLYLIKEKTELVLNKDSFSLKEFNKIVHYNILPKANKGLFLCYKLIGKFFKGENFKLKNLNEETISQAFMNSNGMEYMDSILFNIYKSYQYDYQEYSYEEAKEYYEFDKRSIYEIIMNINIYKKIFINDMLISPVKNIAFSYFDLGVQTFCIIFDKILFLWKIRSTQNDEYSNNEKFSLTGRIAFLFAILQLIETIKKEIDKHDKDFICKIENLCLKIKNNIIELVYNYKNNIKKSVEEIKDEENYIVINILEELVLLSEIYFIPKMIKQVIQKKQYSIQNVLSINYVSSLKNKLSSFVINERSKFIDSLNQENKELFFNLELRNKRDSYLQCFFHKINIQKLLTTNFLQS